MNNSEFSEMMNIVKNVKDSATLTSLPKFIKPAIIQSANFLQDSLAEEPVVNDILKNLYNVYIGYIITALQMNDLVADGRRIRDILAPVSTSPATEAFIDTKALTDSLTVSLEGIPPAGLYDDNHEVTAVRYAEKTSMPIASGRQIELKLSVGNDQTISVLVTVQFNTRLIPTEVFEYIFGQDFNRSIYTRWLQLRSGEIGFVKDFIFGMDRAERRAKALKKDSTNALSDILRHQSKALFKHSWNAATGDKGYNLANSIMIVDEETATHSMKKAGFNIKSVSDRTRFFNLTYNLFIVLVDRHYSRVTIYTNGIDQSATYSFNELKASAASDKMSITEVMEYLTKSQLPKF